MSKKIKNASMYIAFQEAVKRFNKAMEKHPEEVRPTYEFAIEKDIAPVQADFYGVVVLNLYLTQFGVTKVAFSVSETCKTSKEFKDTTNLLSGMYDRAFGVMMEIVFLYTYAKNSVEAANSGEPQENDKN